MKTATISSKNQITLPKALTDAYQLKRGSSVVVEPGLEGIVIRPLKKNVVADYYGYAQATWRALGGGKNFIERERRSWNAHEKRKEAKS